MVVVVVGVTQPSVEMQQIAMVGQGELDLMLHRGAVNPLLLRAIAEVAVDVLTVIRVQVAQVVEAQVWLLAQPTPEVAGAVARLVGQESYS